MSAVGSEVAANAPGWTDAAGVAAFLGGVVPASTVSEFARAGRLPSVKLGNRRLFHLPTVEHALEDAMRGGLSI